MKFKAQENGEEVKVASIIFRPDNKNAYTIGDEQGKRFKLRQFTGVFDFENKEIYEGDRVQVQARLFDFEGTIEFKYGAFIVKNDKQYLALISAQLDKEVKLVLLDESNDSD